MHIETFIVTVFCLVDDSLPSLCAPRRLRQRGPHPRLADSEVLTVEVVGEYLGMSRDTELFRYFRRHFVHLFPMLQRVDRTTFVRQAANLWRVKERLWQQLIEQTGCDPRWAMVESFPVHVCRFARAPRRRTFRLEAGFGRDHSLKATFYGFRLHVRLCWPGVITRVGVTPASVSDIAMLAELVEQTQGCCLGDRNYWQPQVHAELREQGVEMLVGFRKKSRDPRPERSRVMSRLRYRIETVFSQLAERFTIKRVWARDMWHLSNRLLRKVLAHTIGIIVNREQGHEPLRLAEVVTP